jgi:zinc transporter 2
VIILNNPDAIIADPICTFVFSIIVLSTTIGVATECVRCMMEAVPVGMDVIQLENDINKLTGLKDLHDLHVWSLTTGKTSLSAHITSEDPTTTMIEANKLFLKYGIYHSTIQVENWADRKRINCRHLKTNLIHE